MKKSDLNVLIVEDDRSMQSALLEAVKRRGYKAVAVSKPDEAESLVKIKPIHGVIADVMLPGRNGVDLVMKLKENLMEGAGIIFISGIYRDRAFATESVRKTEALEFYAKPFNTEEMLAKLENKLNEYIEIPKVDLHTLLSSPFASQRERRKALDHIETMYGFDLPFVFCILMDSESSGHLNIVDADHNIYGVTFVKGSLSKVDSESTANVTRITLIKHGFISETELNELKSKSQSGDLAKHLVEEGLMSPHASSVIKQETISGELKKLVNEKELKINFVPDRRLQTEPDNIDIASFTAELHDMIDYQLSPEWLKKFYSVWLGHPIRLGPQFADHHQLAGLPILRRVEGIIDLFKKEMAFEDIISQNPKFSEIDVYKALHLMMLRRMLVFEEAKKVKNVDEHVTRLKTMHAELKDKSPIEIFKYFGLNDNPKPVEVATVYKEFAKAHHPDTLPQAVSDDIRKLNHELFSKVTAAYEIFSNEEARQKYYGELKQKEAEMQIKSDELVTESLVHLSRGKYAEAFPKLEEAMKYYESERTLLHYWWASLKVGGKIKADDMPKVEKRLKSMSAGMRKTALWIFINGLIKKAYGDIQAAENEFNKALTAEENFMDARRELANLKAIKGKKLTTEDILKGDISSVVKGLFKKKGA